MKTYREIRDRLAGDRGGEARALLNLDHARHQPGQRVVRLRRGVPSEATICRHRTRHFPEAERLGALHELAIRLRDEHLAMPELRAEAQLLDVDGTGILTHYTAPIYKAKKKSKKNKKTSQAPAEPKLANGGVSKRGYPLITAPDAGYLPKSAGFEKTGHGWNLVTLVTQTGVPLAWRLTALHHAEATTAAAMLREDMPRVIDLLGPRQMPILTADGNFTGAELRTACHSLGINENIHPISHGDSDRTKRNVRRADRKRIPIRDYPDWFTNGHRELKCVCGQSRVIKRSKLGPDGDAIPRVEGHCKTCGSITITAGQWYLAQNPSQWRRADSAKPHQDRDYLFGNPLTYHDVVSKQYGRKRFGHNEGFHGALGTRFGLTDEKRWFRRRAQAEIEVATTFAIMHAVAMEQRRRLRAAQAPPGAVAA